MSEPQLKWTKNPLRRERYIGSYVRSIISDYNADRKGIYDCDVVVSIGRRVIRAIEDFDAQLAAQMMTVTMEDGSKELRLAEEEPLEFVDHYRDGLVRTGYGRRPELKDDEELAECVDGSILIVRRPA